MGQEIVYCSVCGDRILASEFEKGRAVTLFKKNYCRRCAKDAAKADRGKAGNTDGAKTPPSRRPEGRLPAPADHRVPPPVTLLFSTPFMVAIGIAVLAVILLAIVMARSR